MPANYLADVVAEEASKRLLPFLHQEKKAERCEQTRTLVAKRLAMAQADIWTKREEADEIYELVPLKELEVATTHSSIVRLVGEIGKARKILERHKSGMRCRNSDIHRAHRKFHLWRKTPRKPGEVSPKDSTLLHFHLYTTLSLPAPHQKLAAVLFEEELDATSPGLGACSASSSVGLGTSAAVSGVVGASST